MIIRPSFTVLSGAAIGLVAGAAVYGAVSSSATQTLKPAKAIVASVPAAPAKCAAGQKLEGGVCIVHVVRTVVAPLASAGQVLTTPRGSALTSGTKQNSGSPASGDATKVGGDAADDATEAAREATDGSGTDQGTGAPSDTSSAAPRD
jgi:hypothetical protein